ncbi:MAG: serine hydroxymethyltransferase [Alphaproteobacteria bacterium]|nr:serine hydroxymethyltransferase [Alphaproteobacteria bacterium]
MRFFTRGLKLADKAVYKNIKKEFKRQRDGIELIASENLVSKAVMEAQGSILTNKYAEGYPGKRYYGGCEFVDNIEQLAIDRVCELFGCKYANVQPNSGSQANQAVFLALLNPGDKILGMSLDNGGHLTHGCPVNMSGKWFKPVSYGVNDDGFLNYEEVEKLAKKHKPKLIIAGASAYSRQIDFKKFREIADSVGAYLMVDMAHYAGLIAANIYDSPMKYADVVTSTTHKTLRGPRGGLILWNNKDLTKKINSAIFPGLQGGPLEHVIAGKAVCFGEALKTSFKKYQKQVLKNSKMLAKTLQENGVNVVSEGTDSHIVLVDLRSVKLTGKKAEKALEEAGLTCNKNTIPNDPESPFVTSGIRLGTPAGTTRGFKEKEFKKIAVMISNVLKAVGTSKEKKVIKTTRSKVINMCDNFPIY